jgi:hypothetical protein
MPLPAKEIRDEVIAEVEERSRRGEKPKVADIQQMLKERAFGKASGEAHRIASASSPRPASETRTVRLDASHIPSGTAPIGVRLDDEFASAQRLVIGMEVYDRSTTEAKMAKLARAATELGRDREAIRRVAEIIIAALGARVRH